MSTTTGAWPVIAGTYKVADPKAPVAVCALTSEKLVDPLIRVPGVAIAGIVYTANLGITRIIMNVTSNPSIRFLLICGRDSPLFKPGQSLAALADNGVDDSKKIKGAAGYDPVLGTLSEGQIKRFREQVEVLDWTGEEDVQTLTERIDGLSARSPGTFNSGRTPAESMIGEKFVSIRPGGQREPLIYDPKGYFVISLDRANGEIILKHYRPDHTPAHEMRGRGTTSMLLGLLREGLVSQLSHAGYLGEELAKAQTALQFNLRYDQDRLLRYPEPAPEKQATPEKDPREKSSPSNQSPGKMPTAVPQPMSLEQFQASLPCAKVDVVVKVADIEKNQAFRAQLLRSDEAEPFSVFHPTSEMVRAEWTPTTRFIMGVAEEAKVDAILRVVAKLDENRVLHAEQIVVLTKVAKIA